MTAEERSWATVREWAGRQSSSITLVALQALGDMVAQAIREAEASEREACAKVAEPEEGSTYTVGQYARMRSIAEAIRARGGEGEG